MSATENALIHEVLELLKDLDKKEERGDFEAAVDCLKRLQHIPMTIDILKKTNVGKRSAKLFSHSNTALATIAKTCVGEWKKLAVASGAIVTTPSASSTVTTPTASSSSSTSTVSVENNNDLGKSSSQTSTSSSSSSSTSSILPTGSNNDNNHSTATLSSSSSTLPSSSASTGLFAKPTLSLTRQRVKDMIKKNLYDVVQTYKKTENPNDAQVFFGGVQNNEEVQEQCDGVSGRIEQALFDHLAGGNADHPHVAYTDQFKVIAANLKRNVPLSMNIYCGFVPSKSLCFMKSIDFISNEEKEKQEKIRREAMEETQVDWKEKNKQKVLDSAGIAVSEGILVCPKCKSKNTEYYQKQTRSADEPMTTFANCQDCGKRWTFN